MASDARYAVQRRLATWMRWRNLRYCDDISSELYAREKVKELTISGARGEFRIVRVERAILEDADGE
jgi:hypothetical protein